VFAVTFVTTFAWRANSAAIMARTHRTPATERGVRVVVLAAIGAGLIALPFLVGSIFSQILGTVGIYILLGLGLNIVVGYAGLLDLGYVAFFAVGAYTTAILTGGSRVTTTGYAPPSFSLHLSFFVAIPIVVAVAALVGLVIGAPVLRLRGDYLAIVTLGFGEIARVLFSSDWLKGAFGGTQGITAIPAAPIGNLDFRNTQHFYFLVLAFCLIAVYISWRLADSRVGRAWNAMREDEQVAEAVGVSTVRYKLLAFAMGGAIGSLGGALFAVQVGALNNASFMLLVSITALAVVILGGMGSIPGVIVGALVLIGIPGVFSEFEQYRLLLYGAVLMAIMILRPQGLIPNVRRSQELEEEDVAQDKWAGAVTADEHAAPATLPLGEGAG
jgi:branched-chain amino acid transport system permease protein